MGQKKTAIRQNVLDGDNLPNAILNAVIAGYDADTIVNDTIEVLQQGDTTSFMFEATPDAIEQFADTFVAKVQAVAAELRSFEYIDKPVIRRKDTPLAKPDARVEGGPEAEGAPEAEGGSEAEGAGEDAPAGDDEGMEVESAEEAQLVEEPPLAAEEAAEEETIRMVPVSDVEIDMILATLGRAGGKRYRGKVAIKFPNSLAGLGASVAAALSKQGVDTEELAEAVSDYVIDFIARNPGRFGRMDAGAAADTLEFTEMAFSESNDRAIVSTFEVGGEA